MLCRNGTSSTSTDGRWGRTSRSIWSTTTPGPQTRRDRQGHCLRGMPVETEQFAPRRGETKRDGRQVAWPPRSPARKHGSARPPALPWRAPRLHSSEDPPRCGPVRGVRQPASSVSFATRTGTALLNPLPSVARAVRCPVARRDVTTVERQIGGSRIGRFRSGGSARAPSAEAATSTHRPR